jgi:hypothetical protein
MADKLVENLNNLVEDKTIKSYVISNVDDNGIVGKKSKFRNTQRLSIEFNNNQSLVIDTFCSGKPPIGPIAIPPISAENKWNFTF